MCRHVAGRGIAARLTALLTFILLACATVPGRAAEPIYPYSAAKPLIPPFVP